MRKEPKLLWKVEPKPLIKGGWCDIMDCHNHSSFEVVRLHDNKAKTNSFNTIDVCDKHLEIIKVVITLFEYWVFQEGELK